MDAPTKNPTPAVVPYFVLASVFFKQQWQQRNQRPGGAANQQNHQHFDQFGINHGHNLEHASAEGNDSDWSPSVSPQNASLSPQLLDLVLRGNLDQAALITSKQYSLASGN